MPTTQYTKRYGVYRAKIYKSVLPVLQFISMKTQAELKFPIMKVLKAIAKKLLLNLHQALYLAYCLENEWPIQDQLFFQHSVNIRDIIFHRRPEQGYTTILLYLLLQTASIKMNFNDNFRIYTAELQSALPDFRPILAQFMQKYPLQQCSPKQLNRIFKQVARVQSQVDYQDTVDNILHICLTYRINGQEYEASSNTNTFTKKHSSQNKTAARQTQTITMNFQLQSEKSILQRPIMQQDEFGINQQFFRYQSNQCYTLPLL